MAQIAQNTKWCSQIELLEVPDLADQRSIKSRPSTNNHNPRETESLRNFMLKVFCTLSNPAPFSVKSSLFSVCIQTLTYLYVCIHFSYYSGYVEPLVSLPLVHVHHSLDIILKKSNIFNEHLRIFKSNSISKCAGNLKPHLNWHLFICRTFAFPKG